MRAFIVRVLVTLCFVGLTAGVYVMSASAYATSTSANAMPASAEKSSDTQNDNEASDNEASDVVTNGATETVTTDCAAYLIDETVTAATNAEPISSAGDILKNPYGFWRKIMARSKAFHALTDKDPSFTPIPELKDTADWMIESLELASVKAAFKSSRQRKFLNGLIEKIKTIENHGVPYENFLSATYYFLRVIERANGMKASFGANNPDWKRLLREMNASYIPIKSDLFFYTYKFPDRILIPTPKFTDHGRYVSLEQAPVWFMELTRGPAGTARSSKSK